MEASDVRRHREHEEEYRKLKYMFTNLSLENVARGRYRKNVLGRLRNAHSQTTCARPTG